jgi:hypothetical protein
MLEITEGTIKEEDNPEELATFCNTTLKTLNN